MTVVETGTDIGYRLRYLADPWELVQRGGAQPGEHGCRPLDQAHSPLGVPEAPPAGEPRRDWCTVLEIPRQGSDRQAAGTVVLPKYYLEASVEECEPVRDGSLYPPERFECQRAPSASCAELAARCELELLVEAGDSADVTPRQDWDDVRRGENDFGQTFYEYLTLSAAAGQRFRRGVMFQVDDARYVRLFLSAFPRLDETEVDRLVGAAEVLNQRTAPGEGP